MLLFGDLNSLSVWILCGRTFWINFVLWMKNRFTLNVSIPLGDEMIYVTMIQGLRKNIGLVSNISFPFFLTCDFAKSKRAWFNEWMG